MKPTIECPDFDYLNWQAAIEDVRANGRRKTQSLFKERIRPRQIKRYPPIYTLCERPVWCNYWERWLPSAKQIYVLSDTEYEAAMKLVGSIEHWNMLIANDWFVCGTDDASWTSLTQWRQEQLDRKAQLAESSLVKMAENGNVAAAKALLSAAGNGRGRPSKEEVEGTKKNMAKASSDVEDDAARLGLTRVK